MEMQQDVNDTLTVMKKYNFHKPMDVTIIYEDNEEVPSFHNSHKGGFNLLYKIVDILGTIKENLTRFCGDITRCKDKKLKDQLRAHWIRVRHRLSDECLAASKEYIIQHGVADQFIKDILCKIELVLKMPITYNLISSTQDTLLKWIELKKFQMTSLSSDKNQNYSPLAQTTNSHFGSENVINNLPLANTCTSRPPDVGRQQWTTQNDNSGMHSIPHWNYSYDNVDYQQLTTPNVSLDPIGANDMNYSGPLLNVPERSCYNGSQINSNVVYTQGNIRNADNTTRNSISRDSGFISPLTSVSPLEYHYDITQYSSLQKEQNTSNYYMPDMMTIEPNIINVWPR